MTIPNSAPALDPVRERFRDHLRSVIAPVVLHIATAGVGTLGLLAVAGALMLVEYFFRVDLTAAKQWDARLMCIVLCAFAFTAGIEVAKALYEQIRTDVIALRGGGYSTPSGFISRLWWMAEPAVSQALQTATWSLYVVASATLCSWIGSLVGVDVRWIEVVDFYLGWAAFWVVPSAATVIALLRALRIIVER